MKYSDVILKVEFIGGPFCGATITKKMCHLELMLNCNGWIYRYIEEELPDVDTYTNGIVCGNYRPIYIIDHYDDDNEKNTQKNTNHHH